MPIPIVYGVPEIIFKSVTSILVAIPEFNLIVSDIVVIPDTIRFVEFKVETVAIPTFKLVIIPETA